MGNRAISVVPVVVNSGIPTRHKATQKRLQYLDARLPPESSGAFGGYTDVHFQLPQNQWADLGQGIYDSAPPLLKTFQILIQVSDTLSSFTLVTLKYTNN